MRFDLPQRGLRLGYSLALVGALAGVFATLVVMEDRTGSLGWDYAFKVSSTDIGETPTQSTYDELRRATETYGVNIGRFRVDTEHPANARVLELLIGDTNSAQAEWIRAGYPQFGFGTTIAIRDFDPAAIQNLAGDYILSGNEAGLKEVLNVFEEAGFVTQSSDLSNPVSFVLWLLTQAMAPGLISLALLSVLLTVLGALSSVRRYSISRLHGTAIVRLLGRDLTGIFLVFWPAWIVVILSLTGMVIWSNRGNQLALYIEISAKSVLTSWAVLVFCHAVAIFIAARVPIHRAITGRSLARGSLPVLSVVRVGALIFALLFTFPLVENQETQREQDSAIDQWKQYPDASFINISATQSPREYAASTLALGKTLRDIVDDGGMILATPIELSPNAQPTRVLRVNPTFLTTQRILDESDSTVIPDLQRATLLIPADRWAERESLLVEARAETSADHNPQAPGSVPLANSIDTIAVKTQPGQSVFTFASRPSNTSPATLVDPIILVTPVAAGALSSDDYAAVASRGEVLALNRDALRTVLNTTEARGLIRSYEPAGETARVERERTARDLTGAVFGTIAALLVLIGGALGTAEFTTRNRSTELFVQFASGWRFTRRFRRLLIGEVILAVAGLGILVAEIARRSQYRSSDPVEPSMLPIFLAGVAVVILSSGVLIAGLHLFPTRSRRTGGSDD